MAELLKMKGGMDAAPAARAIVYREHALGLRSRILLWLMRLLFRPIVGFIFGSGPKRLAKAQMQAAGMRWPRHTGVDIDYRVIDRSPGHVLGALGDARRPVVLWLHGGGFVIPAAPAQHLLLVARLCRDLDADGFMPDYRLAPANPFPAGLNDCEQAYRALLERGFAAGRIVLGGDSAGGNLVLALLQRIRKAGLPMPSSALLLSPVTELGRGHGPPSRPQLMHRDPLLPALALPEALKSYVGDHDSSDPEVSPLYMDCDGLPPMFFVATTNEILRDDTVLLVKRMAEAGAPVRCEMWPHFPHAFSLFEPLFPETRPAREALVAFAKQHLRQ